MASYPISSRRYGFAAALEATQGTGETITLSSHAMRLADFEDPTEGYLRPNLRDTHATGGLGVLGPAEPAGRFYEMPLTWVPIGAGSAYAFTSESNLTVPEHDALIVCAGFTRTVDATPSSESVTYALSDDPQDGTYGTVTTQLQFDNKEYAGTAGVLAGLSLECEAGGYPTLSGPLRALATAPAEQALESHTYDSTALPIWKGSSALTISGASGVVPLSVSIDWGLEVSERPNATATDAHGGWKTVAYRPVLTLRAETLALSSWNPYSDRAASTSRTIDLVFGDTQYERFDIDIDAAYVLEVDHADVDGKRIWEVQYLCATPSSGAVCSIVFD